jgi:hypothetical protein
VSRALSSPSPAETALCQQVGSLPTLWQEKVVDYLTKAADICGREHCQIVLDLTDLTHLLPRVADFIFPQYLAKVRARNVRGRRWGALARQRRARCSRKPRLSRCSRRARSHTHAGHRCEREHLLPRGQ